jgi:hypothetical protein
MARRRHNTPHHGRLDLHVFRSLARTLAASNASAESRWPGICDLLNHCRVDVVTGRAMSLDYL